MDATLHVYLYVSGRVWAVTVPPVVFQCRLQRLVSPAASQCGAVLTKFLQWHSSGAVSTKFFQWCSSVPCKYSLGRSVVSQCTLGQPVAFQWHFSVHWTSQCKLAQGKGSEGNMFNPIFKENGSATTHLHGCFCSWTFSWNIGYSMFPSDSFTPCLDYVLGYSTGGSRLCNNLSLRCFALWINPLTSLCWSNFWKNISKLLFSLHFFHL